MLQVIRNAVQKHDSHGKRDERDEEQDDYDEGLVDMLPKALPQC